ncbi:MAG: UPF0164 family protein, partial [Elusimicrobia bacterium]|nr:UPF0164 family protein [Candidatus Obscuribacterium magneticum]
MKNSIRTGKTSIKKKLPLPWRERIEVRGVDLVKLLTSFALGCLFWSISDLSASIHTDDGTSGAQSLVMQTGVRAKGMGGAFCAIADDINTIYNNPAGIGIVKRIEVELRHKLLFEGAQQSNFGVIIPLTSVS